jgi:hypothetical protein
MAALEQAQPASLKVQRSTLTAEECDAIDACRHLLADVFTPFKSLEAAVQELQTGKPACVHLLGKKKRMLC